MAITIVINLKITQPGGIGRFEVPNWDQASQTKVRDALLVLNETLPDLRNASGRKEEVDPVRHLIGTAWYWGLNCDKAAVYLNVTPTKNDGNTIPQADSSGQRSGVRVLVGHRLRWHRPSPQEPVQRLFVNSVTARKNAHGSVAIQFGGCDGKVQNCLPTLPGWNYTVRLYRPRSEIATNDIEHRTTKAKASMDQRPG